jgi:hypothetical protein
LDCAQGCPSQWWCKPWAANCCDQALPSARNTGKACAQNRGLISPASCRGALQELEETRYWLDLLNESQLVEPESIMPISAEADQLFAMFMASINIAKRNKPEG